MFKPILKAFLFILVAFVFTMSFIGQSGAATNVFQYDVEFSGATSPTGPLPWVTATFDDSFGGANTVRLTMSAVNLQNNEFVDDWLFNFDSALDPTQLSFSFIEGSAGAANGTLGVKTGIDTYKADGDGFYDIIFDYAPPPGDYGAKFTAGEVAVYDITYTSAIDISSFNFFSAPGGGSGTYLGAAHIQGIADPSCLPENPDCESGWAGVTVVPEPISSTLFIIGGATLGFRRFRKQTKK